MTQMLDIDAWKQAVDRIFAELEEDISVLHQRVVKARADLQKVQTEEEAVKFDDSYDFEEGLKHIIPWGK